MSARAHIDPYLMRQDWRHDLERVAYTLLETARIRCERLPARPILESRLRTAHRDLGLAGYYACADLDPQTRAECLEIAQAECDSSLSDDPRLILATIFDEALTACDSLAAAIPLAVGDHVDTAHMYVLAACEALDAQLDQFTPELA